MNIEIFRNELEGKKVPELKRIAAGYGIEVQKGLKAPEVVEVIIQKQLEPNYINEINTEENIDSNIIADIKEQEVLVNELEEIIEEDNENGIESVEIKEEAESQETECIAAVEVTIDEAIAIAEENESINESEQSEKADEVPNNDVVEEISSPAGKSEDIFEHAINADEPKEELKDNIEDTQIHYLPLSVLDPSPLNFFHPLKDKKYKEVKESIETLGLLQPIVVRTKQDGRFEVLAGHNRVYIFNELGKETIPSIIKNVDDDEAEEIISDTNMAQRDEKTPMEIAKAYEIKARALGKRQGQRSDLNVGQKGSWREIVGKEYEVSGMTVERYMRLNNLIPEFQQLIDNGKINVKTGFELGLVDKDTQEALYMTLDLNNEDDLKKVTPAMATKIKKAYQKNNEVPKEMTKKLKKEDKEPEKKSLSANDIENIITEMTDSSVKKDLVIKIVVPADFDEVTREYVEGNLLDDNSWFLKIIEDLAYGRLKSTNVRAI